MVRRTKSQLIELGTLVLPLLTEITVMAPLVALQKKVYMPILRKELTQLLALAFGAPNTRSLQNIKLKTRVIKKDVNPEWNEDLTLSVSDANLPVKLTVYDHDMFSMDDKMGDAEFEIKPFLVALEMNLVGLPCGTVITRAMPCRSNCLAEESKAVWQDNKVVQDMCLRLRNVECGEVELQLQWIDLPGNKRT